MGENEKRAFSLDDILEEQRKKREEKESTGAEEPLGQAEPASAAPAQKRPAPSKPQGTVPQGTARRTKPPQERTTSAAPQAKPSRPKPAQEDAPVSQPPARSANRPAVQEPDDTVADLNQFATGSHEIHHPSVPADVSDYDDPREKKKKKKKKGRGLFGRRGDKVPEFDESDETVYGLQLKPIDEYRKGFNPTGEFSLSEESYAALFDDSKKAIDVEVEKNFQRLQEERKSRVAQAVKQAGGDKKQIEEELGIVAPMPVSSYSADPYAKQHGVEVEGVRRPENQLPEFQQAQLAEMQRGETMEIKLNILNETMELQKITDEDTPSARWSRQDERDPVEDAAVRRVLSEAPAEDTLSTEHSTERPKKTSQGSPAKAPKRQVIGERTRPRRSVRQGDALGEQDEVMQAAQAMEAHASSAQSRRKSADGEDWVQRRPESNGVPKPQQREPSTEETRGTPSQPDEGLRKNTTPRRRRKSANVQAETEWAQRATPEETPSVQDLHSGEPLPEEDSVTTAADKDQPAAQSQSAPTEDLSAKDVLPPLTTPKVSSIFEYRKRGLPTHVIRAEVLQNAILSEGENLEKTAQFDSAGKRQPGMSEDGETKSFDRPIPGFTSPDYEDEGQESIDDFTGPEDIKSVTNELKADMHDLTLRILVTGVCTVLLAIVNLVFGIVVNPDYYGASPAIYSAMTLVFFGIAAGVCFRTIFNGLKALFTFQANSDSAVSIAAIGVLVQTVAGFFFPEKLAAGGVHLYAAVLVALLFLNAVGKLTMLRRIHSNFRFVSSKEQKYAVRIFEDHNEAIKLTGNDLLETPTVAYQCKAGFLKRFLEFSYKPDPSETSSQMMAPLGLIASLLLCLITLVITRDVPVTLSALSGALIACVAASNMLSVNLPISRLAKSARRGGAMVVGYEAIERAGNTNAVMIYADDIFPKGTVVLNGIKTYGIRTDVEDAILAASSLVNQIGGPLSGVFEQVITENEETLPKVEKYEYEDSCGINGWVDGKRIYIGNRKLMQLHKIQSTALDDETQYAIGGKQVVYIAMDLEVVAMMIVTYSADRKKKNELQRLENSGISILLRTTDANVTPQMVAKLFGIDQGYVSLINGKMADVQKQLTQQRIVRADAVIATKGRVESMMTVLSGCVKTKRTINLVVAIQAVAVVLGFVMVAFFACFNSIGSLSAIGLFLFELLSLFVLLAVPKLLDR